MVPIAWIGYSPAPPAAAGTVVDARKGVDAQLARGIVHLVTTPTGEPFPFPREDGTKEWRFHTRAEEAKTATTEAHGVRATDLREVEKRRASGENVRVVASRRDLEAAQLTASGAGQASPEAPAFLVKAGTGYASIRTVEGMFVPVFLSSADAQELCATLGSGPDGKPAGQVLWAPVDKLAALVRSGAEGVGALRFIGYGAVPAAVTPPKPPPVKPSARPSPERR